MSLHKAKLREKGTMQQTPIRLGTRVDNHVYEIISKEEPLSSDNITQLTILLNKFSIVYTKMIQCNFLNQWFWDMKLM